MEGRFSVATLTRIQEHWGEEPGEFSVQLHVELSSAETAGGEAFVVTVISPAQLARELEVSSDQIESGRGLLLMLDYDERVVVEHLQHLISRTGAITWGELEQRISRYFDWLD